GHRTELPRRRRHPFPQMVEKGLDLGRQMSRARIDRVDWNLGRTPLGKHAHELLGADGLNAPEGRKHRYAEPCRCRLVEKVEVVDRKTGSHVNREGLAVPVELPARAKGARTKDDTVEALQIVRFLGDSVLLQEAR